MYIPRGKLLALVTIVVAASLVTATGAFSSVEAERTAEVEVAGDANAYLGLQASDGSNGVFAEENPDTGELEISFDDTADDVIGEGVNPGSVTSFDNVFIVRNQGTQKVDVTVDGGTEEDISIYDSNTSDDIEDQSIEPGKSIHVGLKIDASDKTKDAATFDEKITISASTEDSAEVDTSLPDSSSGSSGDSDEAEGESEDESEDSDLSGRPDSDVGGV